MNKGKPTVDEIKELYTRCKTIYDPLVNQFKEDQMYYELDFKNLIGMPIEYPNSEIVLPTARDIVDVCVDHTDIMNARVFVNRKGTSMLSAEEQEMMRKFYLGIIHRTNVESTISPWRVGAKHYWLHGLGVFKTVWDADRWLDKPERKESESESDYASRIDDWRATTHESIPIVIQPVNPCWVMPDPYDNGGRFIFEVQERLVYDVQSKYPSWGNPMGGKINDKVECVSFWTPDYRCELYDGEPVLKVRGGVGKHDYGFIPYVLIDTGLGNVSFDNDPKMKYVGVLRYIKDMLVSESRNYSMNDLILKECAFPWLTLEGKGAETVGAIDIRFGSATRLPDGVKLTQRSPQVPPQALQQHLAITSSYISAHAAPNVVRGLGEQGVRSGVDRRQMIAEASTRYQYATEAFRNGTAKVLTNCARLMKNIVPGDIRVWARTPTDEFDMEIKKDKMKEPFTCYVEFAPVSEEDEYTRHNDLERLVQSGIVSRRWARTQMSNVDPSALELEEEVERLKLDPAVQQVVSQYMTGKLMEALSKRSAGESLNNPPPPITQPMQPQGQQPAMSPTNVQLPRGLPNIPALGSAQDIENRLKNLRQQTPINPNQGQGGGGNR